MKRLCLALLFVSCVDERSACERACADLVGRAADACMAKCFACAVGDDPECP